MSLVLIIGESGTGKSTSIRNLKPKETFLLQILDKPLPFRGGNKKYIPKTKENNGNKYQTDDWNQIMKVIEAVNKDSKIKTLVVDDFHYIMSNEFMRRVEEKGWDKFTDIAAHIWRIINFASKCRPDLNIFFMAHSQEDQQGKAKCKTIGRMLDEKICLEGMFTIVLNSKVIDDKYVFQTRTDYTTIAKTPMDMFQEKYIDNDLQYVIECIEKYYNEDVPQ